MSAPQATTDEIKPACTVRLQFPDLQYRETDPAKLGTFFKPCGSCFPDATITTEKVVVGRGNGTEMMHKRHQENRRE